ncbi:PRC-barrel domain-containing protein [Adhaeribacter swui]|uniref:PRC-barrel domain-containing protein n=1 Tax=Adhaeribacter swui TaxID=2086471 RepID=A0A7G7G996_9BACT|nr:PRC-barrel domain-containing protein [Adhaeribacter swui]QNF33730.1 PRC-barrel domain-containing protein [Adhaeribacter swui]
MNENDLMQDNLTGQNQEGGNANWPVRILTATSIIGDQVDNPQGDNLGKIKDIMLDIHKGNITYVVLEQSGILGINEKLFAVPFQALQLDQANQKFVLNASKEQFEQAPGFDKDHWPGTNSHEYYSGVGSYWGNFLGPNSGAAFT